MLFNLTTCSWKAVRWAVSLRLLSVAFHITTFGKHEKSSLLKMLLARFLKSGDCTSHRKIEGFVWEKPLLPPSHSWVVFYAYPSKILKFPYAFKAQIACYELKDLSPVMLYEEIFHDSLKTSKFKRICMENHLSVNRNLWVSGVTRRRPNSIPWCTSFHVISSLRTWHIMISNLQHALSEHRSARYGWFPNMFRFSSFCFWEYRVGFYSRCFKGEFQRYF